MRTIPKHTTRLFVLFICLSFKLVAQKVNETLKLQVMDEKFSITTPVPSELDPVAINAKLIFSEDQKQFAIVMKVNILSSWHIYSSVTKNSPLIATKINENLPPDTAIALGDWIKPATTPFNEEATIFDGEDFYFIRYYQLNNGKSLPKDTNISLYYQACDPYQCFPPQTKTIQLLK
ncbi:hypothetical protein MWU59_09260 [Flavobacteriaceae bacterium F08102]|nr:hypothetical protein [Flavobacteriaceae bacterium F08102]